VPVMCFAFIVSSRAAYLRAYWPLEQGVYEMLSVKDAQRYTYK